MKSPYVGTLTPNEVVTAFFLVLSKEIRQKKTGEPYLSLHLADRTGEIEGKMWDNVAEVMETFERDDFVKVKGMMQVYQSRSQFTIHKLRRLQDHEVDFADFFPCSERNPDEMWAELQGVVAGITNPHLQGLLEAVFADDRIASRYRVAPAAKNIHHACRGGLLEHVLSLCTLCRLTAAHYQTVDLELLLTGAILHDIGKIDELSYVRSFGYSTEGQLLGHIIIGLRIVADKLAHLPDFPAKLRTLIEHMIISHHGELEFGSPKVPVFQEALLLHHLDNLDSKMEAMKQAIKRDHLANGEFTGWVGSLERSLLRKERYLREAVAAQVDDKPESKIAVSGANAEVTTPHTAPEAPVPNAAPVNPPRPAPEPPIPARPQPAAPADRVPHPESRPAAKTLFGEKLQAVLGDRK